MPTTTHRSGAFAQHADVTAAALLAQVSQARKTLGLKQTELAERTGLSRMTVQRAEAEGADPQLSTFLAMALALGLAARLAHPSAADAPAPSELVHRGLHHARTRQDLGERDRQREAALAKSWQAVNRYEPVGLSPVLPALVPGCTQEQASACATVVQWLGSEVGFDFLRRALALAGYQVSEAHEERRPQAGREAR